MDFVGFRWTYIDSDGFTLFFHGFGRDFNDSGVTILSHGVAEWWLAGWPWLVLHAFPYIYMDLHRFGRDFRDSGALVPGSLWRAVAACGSKLWPLHIPCSVLVACRLAGWLDGGGGHHSCNLARSTPRRVGGYIHICIYIYIYIYMYLIHICAYIYIYIYVGFVWTGGR